MKLALGEVIKTFRKELQLKQRYMAHQLGITEHAYANTEHGRSDINTGRLVIVAKLLNTQPCQLIALAEEIINTRESLWLKEVVGKVVALKRRPLCEPYSIEDQFLNSMENSLKKSISI